LRHGPAKIVAARKMPLPLPLGDLIAKVGDPEGLAVFRYPQRLVFENGDPGRTQGTAHPFGAVGGHSGQGAMPPVVIAENRVDAERRVQNRESLAPVVRHHRAGDKPVAAGIIAKQKDDVRGKVIG
jgi:hypothetical protein